MLGSTLHNLASLCVLSLATATELQKYDHAGQSFNANFLKRQEITPINSNTTDLTPQFFTNQGSQRVKVTYGQFVVPPMQINNGMRDFFAESVQIGCKNCTITFIQAGLEYPNGTYANANTSLWLHHVVLYNLNNDDIVCGGPGERFFASGNERSPINLSINGTNTAGYYVGPNDTIAFLTELMNQGDDPQTAIVTITYEYIPGLPNTFHKIAPVWLDIAGCDSDSEEPAKNDTAFQYTSPVWTANATGRVNAVIGHLHDGGVNLDVNQNNSTLCDCVAAYGQTPGYIDPSGTSMAGMTGSMANMGMHVSSLSECSTGQVNLDDNLSVIAYYNTSEYSPMTNTNGSLAPIMGIALLYLAQNETFTSTSTSTSTSSTVASATASGVSSSTSKATAPMLTGGPFLVAGAMGAVVALGFA